MTGKGKSVATILVEIAEDLYTFGRTASTRVNGELVHEGETFAHPKGNPAMARPLADIRPDLAAVYAVEHGSAPSATALGDAMTVLEGKARAAEPDSDRGIIAALAGAGKTNVATVLITMALDAYDMAATPAGEPFAVPKQGPRVALMLRGGRRSLRAELASAYFAEHKTAAASAALADAMLTLEGIASTGEPQELALRVARDMFGGLVLDLGDDTGQVVMIGAGSWAVEDSPVLFRRTKATGVLPEPSEDGSLDELWRLVNVGEPDRPLLAAWLVCALMPDIPHPVLRVDGENGSAKTTTAKFLARIIDPSPAQTSSSPRGIDDWCVACAASWATTLDNVSSIEPWLSDAICKAVTGDGLRKRALYTDSDVAIVAFRRVVALTTIGLPALRGDLASRLLSVTCVRIAEDKRRTESSIDLDWSAAYPHVLGGLCDLAAAVLKVLPQVRLARLPRMADYGQVLAAVDEVLGTDGYARYLGQAREINREVLESDPVALAIREHIHSEWQGAAGELLRLLTPDKPPRRWPETPRAMSAALTRAASALRPEGWAIEQLERTHSGREWLIVPPGLEIYPGEPSPPSQPSSGAAEQGKLRDGLRDGQNCEDATVTDGEDATVTDPHDRHGNAAGHDGGDGCDGIPGENSRADFLWPPSETGPCTGCGKPCHRYGGGGHPLCDDCRGES